MSGSPRRRRAIQANVARGIFFVCAMVSIVTTIGIVVSLVTQAWGFFIEVSPWEFLTGTRWTPILRPRSYGVLPLVSGPCWWPASPAPSPSPWAWGRQSSCPEYAPDMVRRIIKPILEVLAGIPTVVYGYFALTFVTRSCSSSSQT